MPELIPHAADNPDFARVIEVRQIRDLPRFEFSIAPTAKEAGALARLLDARAVRKLRFAGSLTPAGRGFALDATLGATVVQTCVVSLEPVTTRVDEAVHRAFVLDALAAEVVVDADADDDVEPLGERIDLGRIATEALALALPAYPRKAGAHLGAEAGDDGDADGPRPFAALAALRDKLDDGS